MGGKFSDIGLCWFYVKNCIFEHATNKNFLVTASLKDPCSLHYPLKVEVLELTQHLKFPYNADGPCNAASRPIDHITKSHCTNDVIRWQHLSILTALCCIHRPTAAGF